MRLIDFLCEVGNTTVPITWDHSNPYGLVGDFVLNGVQFRILLETQYDPTLVSIFGDKTHAFVSFLMFDPNSQRYVQDTTGLVGTAATKVFSIVKNAIKPMFGSDFDILFFSAKKDRSPTGYESRIKLYNHLYSRFIHELGCSGYVVPGNNSLTFVLSLVPIDKEIAAIKADYTF